MKYFVSHSFKIVFLCDIIEALFEDLIHVACALRDVYFYKLSHVGFAVPCF